MCGIIGIIDGCSHGSRSNEPLMSRMLDIMAHRGPDAQTIYESNGVTLGHLRLSIIDIEGGQQPFFNDDRSLVTVFNGEIYNYKEIRAELIKEGVSFHSNSDTEVLLKGYEHYGSQIVSKLNGIFSFAILHIDSGKVFLARDHFGIKPLFYYQKDGLLIFASEQKAILMHPEVPRETNNTALHQLLNLRYVQSKESLFKGIYQLEPGSYATFENDKLTSSLYYQMQSDIDYNMSEQDAIDGIHHYIGQAIERQLVSDVPIGVYLSGGLDSSTIVQKMSSLGVKKINTFTLGFNEPTDEFSDAKLIADTFGTNHREMALSFDPLQMFPEVLWHAELPKINLLQGFNMSKFVQPHVKVVLGGLGGDELFAGYDIHKYINPTNNWHKRMPNWLQKLMKLKSDFLFKLQFASGTLQYDEYRRGMQMLLSIGDIEKYYLIIRNVWEFDNGMYDAIYSKSFLNQMKKQHSVYKEFKPLFDSVSNSSPLDQVLMTEMKSKMVNDYLFVNDRVSMANSIEERVPFLDVDLVEFANRMPIHHKIKNGTTKYIFRKAMEPLLPKHIVKKKKWGFSVNPYLQFNKDLKGVCEKILTKEYVETQGVFNYDYIKRILDAKPHPKMRWHYNLLWVMMGYAMWHKMYIDGDGFKQRKFDLEGYYS